MVFHSLSTRPGKSDLVQLLVEGKLAGKETPVERGQGELDIIGVESAGFLDRAGAGAGAQADVPHALNNVRGLPSLDCSSAFSSAKAKRTSISE